MKHLDKNKVIAVVLITILSGALLVYTATRTLHLIESTLPADQKVLAWFALAAFDLGLPLWTAYTLWGARGAWQRGIAALMVFVSLLGVVIAFGGDTLIQAEAQGVSANLASAETVRWIIYGTVGIIGLNIVAVTFCHLTDPDALRNEKTESANDRLLTAELEHMAENAETLAADIAPVRAFAWRVKREQELLADLPPDIRAQYMRSGGLLAKPKRADDAPAGVPVRAFAQEAQAMPRTEPVQYTALADECRREINSVETDLEKSGASLALVNRLRDVREKLEKEDSEDARRLTEYTMYWEGRIHGLMRTGGGNGGLVTPPQEETDAAGKA